MDASRIQENPRPTSVDRIVLDDATDVPSSSGSGSSDDLKSRGDCRGGCRPGVLLHADMPRL
jgi:hypothetical protein